MAEYFQKLLKETNREIEEYKRHHSPLVYPGWLVRRRYTLRAIISLLEDSEE